MSKKTALPWFWMVLILTACWLPKSILPENQDRDHERPFPLNHIDKMVHAGLFFCFTLSAFAAKPNRRWPLVAVTAAALAVVSELGQAMPLVDREPGVLDAAADLFGVAIGLVLALRLAERARDDRLALEPEPGPAA